jgi:metal-responsive CopG/Arc/MetJ family transcriptional regulator
VKTVQMTLDEDLVRRVDEVVASLNTTRSAFTRDALRDALESLKIQDLEARHRKGYLDTPVKSGEFGIWAEEQSWPE